MKDLTLHQVYKIASFVEGAIDLGITINFSNKKNIELARQKAISFDKHTLLHLFIKQEFTGFYKYWFLNMSEEVCSENIELQFIEDQFYEYGVDIDFLKIKYDEDDTPITTNRQVENWYKKNSKKFDTLAERICDEIFFILFSNRKLLHKFNENNAMSFSKFCFQQNQLTNKGKLKRQRIPKWLQKAVFHRDKGRCSFCSTDLTKIINIESANNYDHIIPLDLFGINDPTNIQLLCKACNLDKLNRNTDVGTKYQEWFI